MKNFLAIGFAALSAAACQTTNPYTGASHDYLTGKAVASSNTTDSAAPILSASQTAVRDQGNNLVIQSTGKRSLVSLSRQTSDASRPYQEYGNVFTVAVVNLGNQPVTVGPESVTVSRDNRQFGAMNAGQLQAVANRLEADRQDEIRAKQFLGSLLGHIGGQVTNQTAAQILNISSKVAELSANQAIRNSDRAQAESAEMMQQFSNTSLASAVVPKMQAAGGWILVDGVKNAGRYRVNVNVGGELHSFDFASEIQASR